MSWLRIARKPLPPDQANVLAAPSADPVRDVLREGLDEFERVHLLLRPGGRVCDKHGD